MAGPDPMPPEPGPDAAVGDIQADIERTRKELGDTVGALSAKLDVKERTKQKAAETKQRVVEKAETVRHVATEDPKVKVPLIAVLVIGALTVGIVVWRRRR
ncbi:MAG: hypothetical protein V7643_3285 [Mycobacterium sp.]|jgi:phage host-nuclease inhibitor protein Gam